MPLTPGACLGPYEIASVLGAGGMGEVYKARDTRLDRIVAIKVLRAEIAGPEFRERFSREAKAISQLNHPNICTLYDVGRDNDVDYLVMEYLDGETLAARIAKGPLPVDQALACATQIADALDQAHRQGILHRDLKPGNVILSVSGAARPGSLQAKLVDFGLAKAVAPAKSPLSDLTAAPTLTSPLTSQGTIVGTFQYMAPEVVEGDEADARADIWGLGCILYEMLTGRRPFAGKSQAGLLGSILKEDPAPVSAAQPLVPPALDRVVRTCLAKDPNERVQSAHDLLLHLRWIAEGGSAAGVPAPVVAHRRSRDRWTWIAIGVAAGVVLAAGTWLLMPARERPATVTRFTRTLPMDQQFTRTGRHVVAISPDGTKLAYIANQQIYLWRMNELEAQPIRGTAEDPLDLLFSPDGEWIAYFVPPPSPAASANAAGAGRGTSPAVGPTGPTLKKIPVSGGASSLALATLAAFPSGASWRMGTIVVGQDTGPIVSVPEGGGPPATLVSLDQKQAERAASPQLLNGGTEVLFTLGRRLVGWNEAQIVVQTLKTGARRVVISGGHDARVLPSGHLVYVRDGTLFAAPFDPRRSERTGDSVPLIVGVTEDPNNGGPGQFSLSDDGQLAYQPGEVRLPLRTLAWVDRQGREEPIPAKPHTYVYARLSPNGSKISLDVREGETSRWIWDVPHELLTRLPPDASNSTCGVWMPDSGSFICRSDTPKEGGRALIRRAADGSGAPEPLTHLDSYEGSQAVSPDGKFLVYRDVRADGGGTDLMLLPLTGDRKPRPLIATPAEEPNAAISPDGRWIAYQSNASGQDEIYVSPFPAADSSRAQVSTSGGRHPGWSRNGRELFYVSTDNHLVAVPVLPGSTFNYGRATQLFDVKPYYRDVSRSYDVADDGRFVMVKSSAPPTSQGAAPTIVVVEHWLEEVKARLRR